MSENGKTGRRLEQFGLVQKAKAALSSLKTERRSGFAVAGPLAEVAYEGLRKRYEINGNVAAAYAAKVVRSMKFPRIITLLRDGCAPCAQPLLAERIESEFSFRARMLRITQDMLVPKPASIIDTLAFCAKDVDWLDTTRRQVARLLSEGDIQNPDAQETLMRIFRHFPILDVHQSADNTLLCKLAGMLVGSSRIDPEARVSLLLSVDSSYCSVCKSALGISLSSMNRSINDLTLFGGYN